MLQCACQEAKQDRLQCLRKNNLQLLCSKKTNRRGEKNAGCKPAWRDRSQSLEHRVAVSQWSLSYVSSSVKYLQIIVFCFPSRSALSFVHLSPSACEFVFVFCFFGNGFLEI